MNKLPFLHFNFDIPFFRKYLKMTSKQDDRIDGRPFYLEEVTIEEPSNDVQYDKVIVEPISKPTSLNKLHVDSKKHTIY